MCIFQSFCKKKAIIVTDGQKIWDMQAYIAQLSSTDQNNIITLRFKIIIKDFVKPASVWLVSTQKALLPVIWPSSTPLLSTGSGAAQLVGMC